MAEKQVYGLQLLTFLVKEYDYQIVNIKGLKTTDYWLVNIHSQLFVSQMMYILKVIF